jgi:methylenetetrahydrofolate--tRNA-(uracil-5-)-methyltransferase
MRSSTAPSCAAVVDAEKVKPREFEKVRYFEGCLPIEVMAERGEQTLSFGPMKPVGLVTRKPGAALTR